MPQASTAGPRRQLAAILFADVHGYSRLMSKNEERTYHRLTQAIGLIRSLIGDYGGQVVQTAGDGVLALFDSAPQALGFAVAIQREFRNEAVWNADDEPIFFRMGINLGEVLLGNGNIQGHSVNVAARIQALARPGGICVTEAVQRVVRDTLGLPMHTLGPQALKNIADPVEVFAIEINGPQPMPAAGLPLELPAVGPLEEASVAVLLLDNLSGDPRDSHLCDGITRDIITNLSRFRDLAVIAPHSAFLFKSLEVGASEIGHRLGVGYLFTGGLERAGAKIRIRGQLAEADTGRVLWSERFDGDLGDVFAFQDEVTDVIAARMAVQINAAERRRALARPPSDLRAYGLILRGQELAWHINKNANLHARRLFEQAAGIDPGYGRSHAAMSRTFNYEWRYAWTASPEGALAKALDLALTATARDALDARGYSELGFAHLYKKQHDPSLAAYERALQLNPNDADILAEMGDALVYAGDSKRAIGLLERAMRLNPYYPDWYLWCLGDAHFYLGDYEQAIGILGKMKDPSEAHRLLASSHAHLDQMEEARHHAQQVLAKHPNFSIAHWRKVPPLKDPSKFEVLVEGLRKAGLK
ncbi:MAG: tetratricopeptide repeat protein [Geminicoccaceae bacterium]